MQVKRTLRPTTIVPSELYVERTADRQLRSIVDDMGRPGYVLVARQMGKTNLLLNMKRERTQDLVLYLDLSSRFETAQSWFRNVIDALLEAFPDEFPFSIDAIADSRFSVNIEPSSEFDRHIRQLLRESKKKIIIILDEIDSLVNTSYSDVILSQVRSMYFSRANYPEYENLTYVLSGVAEPTDLIKDKNISPFNIGEKIYLGNFENREFLSFLRKAGLALSSAVSDAIFKWTNGNPRMTWDLCAELENLLSSGVRIDVDVVDDAVDRLYLQEFDRAPIDHIRTLIESDAQIRSAIIALRYGKVDAIDNKIKSRLYLAGITTSAGGRNFGIANKIVDVAFPDKWIEDLDKSGSAALTTASSSFESGAYGLAIEIYERILNSKNKGELAASDYLRLAIAYLYTSNNVKAISNIGICKKLTSDYAIIQNANFHLGIIYGLQKEWIKSIECFENSSVGPNEDVSQHSNLEIINSLIAIGSSNMQKKALHISNLLIEDLELDIKKGANQALPRLISALFHRAKIYKLFGRRSSALVDIERALKFAGAVPPISILVLKYELSQDPEPRQDLAKIIHERVLKEKVKVGVVEDFGSMLTRLSFVKVLFAILDSSLHREFEEVIRSYVEVNCRMGATKLAGMLDICNEGFDTDTARLCSTLMIHAIGFKEDNEPLDLLRAYKFICIYANDRDAIPYVEKYLELLSLLSKDSKISFDDENSAALMQIALIFRRVKNTSLTKRLFETWRSYQRGSESEYGLVAISLDHFEMDFLRENGAIREARSIAARILNETDEETLEKNFQGLDLSLAANARRAAGKILNKLVHTRTPLREVENDAYRGIERNQWVKVQYLNEDPITRKFKVVEADLRNAICSLIDVMPIVK